LRIMVVHLGRMLCFSAFVREFLNFRLYCL